VEPGAGICWWTQLWKEVNRLIKDVVVIFWETQMMLPEIYFEGTYSDNKDFDEESAY
jgi:hypothetical protein